MILNKLFISRFAKLSCLAFKDIHSELFLSTCEQYIYLIGMNIILNMKSNLYHNR